MSYYLGILDNRGRCLKVIRSRLRYTLEDYALEVCTGRKSCIICDETETIIWACKGEGDKKSIHIYNKNEENTPIGRKMRGISL